MSANGRELAKYFYDKTGLKCASQKMFFGAVSSGDALIKAGWTKEEVMQAIDYLIIHPPSKGMYSLAFLQYVMDATMDKIRATEIKRQMEEVKPVTQDTPTESDDDNKRKYEEQQKAKTKTSKLFNI